MTNRTDKKKNRRIKINDVAERAGVSITTVSRVINDSPHPVNEATRIKVLQAAQELGYAPSALAKAMVTQRSLIVGVIVGDTMDPFFAAIVRGVEDAARELGYLVIVANSDRKPNLEHRYIKTINEYQADGIIFAGGGLKAPEYLEEVTKTLEQYRKRDAPVITLGNHLFPSYSVRVDNEKIIYDAAAYLIKLGHRKIAYIDGPTNITTSGLRYMGYQKAMAEIGEKEVVLPGDYLYQSGRLAAETIASREMPVTAILASNDRMAMGCIKGLKSHGFRIPEDFSVITVGGIVNTEFVSPPLTSIYLPLHELGVEAMHKMIQIRAGSVQRLGNTIVAHRLIVRDSTIACSQNQ
jgi:DNA-binding LacI/PurR family transcriptional regulator